MPPRTMHASHMSNPFAHLNPQHTIQSSHYQSQSIPAGFNSQHAFASLNSFPSTYGGNAFAPSAVFSGGALPGQGQGLASVAAQQGFARGAAMQEHSAHQLEAAGMDVKSGAQGRIRQVWRHNLEQEMTLLRQLVRKYTYVSMDAEFPGIVARPIGNWSGSKAELHFQTLRANCDLLKPIQLGITLWTAQGELLPSQPDPTIMSQLGKTLYPMFIPCTFVFNFRFSLSEDMFSEPSIALLEQSGVEFEKNREMGIDLDVFGAALTSSGLVFSDDINWLSFHSAYDFGYIIKVLTSDMLPVDQHEFFEKVKIFFPRLWDIKFLLRHAQRMQSQGRLTPEASRILTELGQRSGLQDLADVLGCHRVGPAHTAGSDAWLTGSVFWAMKNKIFKDLPLDLAGQIYGLHGVAQPASQQYRDEFFAAQATSQSNGGLHNPSTPTTAHAALQHGLGAFGAYQYPK